MIGTVFRKRLAIALKQKYPKLNFIRCRCTQTSEHVKSSTTRILNKEYPADRYTNVTSSVIKKIGMNLHSNRHHPLGLIRLRIQEFFYENFPRYGGSPLFSIHDNISPVVTLKQNFDNLLVSKDHPSRALSDSYYLNSEKMLRAHTTAHQQDLIQSGLDNFLVIGDVYRRDQVDSSHYPVFHQIDGVRLFTQHQLFSSVHGPAELFESDVRSQDKQALHTMEAVKVLEHDLKSSLEKLALNLFGNEIEIQWVDAYFPFTHPSWEMEIKFQDKWMEVLGCGIIEQEILHTAGAGDKVGWAFGLGLERLAMKLYNIPDIRLFWSKDSGFLSQFKVADINSPITYKPISVFPQCTNDISFWVPDTFHENDFYDLVRSVGGDIVEQVEQFDVFFHPKHQRTSQSYRIVYRHMEKTLTQEEVNVVHEKIEQKAINELGVQLR